MFPDQYLELSAVMNLGLSASYILCDVYIYIYLKMLLLDLTYVIPLAMMSKT